MKMKSDRAHISHIASKFLMLAVLFFGCFSLLSATPSYPLRLPSQTELVSAQDNQNNGQSISISIGNPIQKDCFRTDSSCLLTNSLSAYNKLVSIQFQAHTDKFIAFKKHLFILLRRTSQDSDDPTGCIA